MLRGGSSPLARGLPDARLRCLCRRGIIPARAGFTPATVWWLGSDRDHPRSRGVYGRGGYVPPVPVWIIPARAGFTGCDAVHRIEPWDHPRSRGVYRNSVACVIEQPWIIPARAGFTSAAARAVTLRPDHPRSRGVYLRGGEGVCVTVGSSPLARGLQGRRLRGGPAWGIIPARAGFTGRPSMYGAISGDHPRSRGVYVYITCSCVALRGSSPLARGLPWIIFNPRRPSRIIPARAGFTTASQHPSEPNADHPRSRGVY